MELIKDLAVLTVLVMLTRKRVQIGYVLLICALLFGLLHQMSPLALGTLIYTTLRAPVTLTLLGALFLINVMENIMRHTGVQNRMVAGVKDLSGDPRIAMAALPAIIGLLPSPGGARFSAPMVAEAAKGIKISEERKSAINYWYRHVWEYFLPLYPANLIAVEILQVPLHSFVLAMLPYTAVTFLIGITIYSRDPAYRKEPLKQPDPESWRNVREGLWPIGVIVVLVLFLQLNILLALALVLLTLIVYYRLGISKLKPMLLNSLTPRLFFMAFSTVFLRNILVQSGSIDQLVSYFNSLGLSNLLLTMVLPFILGLMTAQTLPGVAISLPLVMTLFGPEQQLAMGILAFVTNYIGHMLSPLHLCYILSNEYFSVHMRDTYRHLLLPGLAVILSALVITHLM